MGAKPRIRDNVHAELICQRIADGFSLRQIAKEIDCSIGSITQWLVDDAEFAALYARCQTARAERMAAEIEEIADDGSNDWMEREGIRVPDHEHISRSRLRVDTKKWLMAKMMPRKYGDKLIQEHTGPDGAPLLAFEPERMASALLAMLSPKVPEAPMIEHEPAVVQCEDEGEK